MLRVSRYRAFMSSAGTLALCVWFAATPARAVILFNLDNNGDTANPSTGLPWDSVAKITDVTGTTSGASSVYIGNGYMLTANHVDLTNAGYVSLGGVTYAIDTSFSAVQVAAGVDMKIFKLQVIPSVAAVNLYSNASISGNTAYIVGWGVGRNSTDSPLGDTSVTWGDNSTQSERWGVNQIKASGNLTYSTPDGTSYSYTALETVLGTSTGGGLGNNEAALTENDSGSGLFQQINGTWYLVGLNTVVETAGTSNFGTDSTSATGRGDVNASVKVSSYYSQILAIVPEPQTYALMALGLAFLGFCYRRANAVRCSAQRI